MTAPVGVAEHTPFGRRVGRIHKPQRPPETGSGRSRYRTVCGLTVEYGRPAVLTGWPEDQCHRCYPEGDET